jgi:lipopolysaccharide export system protein LptA
MRGIAVLRSVRWAAVSAGLAVLGALPAAAQPAGGVPFGAGIDHDADQPVEISSDALSVDQAAGTATFSGSVVVGQGSLRLAAEQVEVQYGDGPDGGGAVQQIRASGGVTVTTGQETAEGREAVYRVPEGAIEMGGDVIVTQGPNAIAGDLLRIDLEAGVARFEGRVQTIVVPGGPRPAPAQ